MIVFCVIAIIMGTNGKKADKVNKVTKKVAGNN